MKLLLLLVLFSTHLIAKEIIEYECITQPDLKLGLSLTDPKHPTVILEKNNVKVARCFYQTLPTSKPYNKSNVSTDAVWSLQLQRCETYHAKLKDKFKISENASFKQALGTATSYFRMFKDQQPTECKPR